MPRDPAEQLSPALRSRLGRATAHVAPVPMSRFGHRGAWPCCVLSTRASHGARREGPLRRMAGLPGCCRRRRQRGLPAAPAPSARRLRLSPCRRRCCGAQCQQAALTEPGVADGARFGPGAAHPAHGFGEVVAEPGLRRAAVQLAEHTAPVPTGQLLLRTGRFGVLAEHAEDRGERNQLAPASPSSPRTSPSGTAERRGQVGGRVRDDDLHLSFHPWVQVREALRQHS